MMNNVTNGQLELTLGLPAALRPHRFRSHRQSGAAWWLQLRSLTQVTGGNWNFVLRKRTEGITLAP
jgi:hypothetical protein